MRARAKIVAALTLAGAAVVALAHAQRVDPRRGKTILVGAPSGPAPAERVDSARSGLARGPLPAGTLHVAWRRSLGLPIDAPPLIDARGDVTVLTARGDVVVLAPDGVERTHTAVGTNAATPAALLSDGTAVFLSGQGDALGVRLANLRFRTRIGGGKTGIAPLALEDGGFVVALENELVALDGEGGIRARAPLPPHDAPANALLGAAGAEGATVYAVTTNGAAWAWVPASGREARLVGSFAGPTDGGAAIVAGGSVGLLVAVVGSQLLALDPTTGILTTRGSAPTSGAVALLGPPATRGGAVTVLGVTPSRTLALTFDPAGAELLHQALAPSLLLPLPDGGTGPGQLPAHGGLGHAGPLVDPQGNVAFALPSGEVGVASVSGAVDVLSDVCTRFNPTSPLANLASTRTATTYAGLLPAAPYALVLACSSGVVARIDSDFAPSP